MFARWLLEDATSSLNAQLLELTPSLLGSVTTQQPLVTALGGSDAWVRARAWRDVGFEAQAAGPSEGLCVHVAVASVGARPGTFTLRFDGLCPAAGCPPAGVNATHLFTESYAVPLLPLAGGAHSLTDVLLPGSTAVYALGCDAWRTELGNLVNDPGFEATELPLTPGFLTCAEEAQYPKGSFKGKCKVEDKHAGSWGLNQQPELRDGRAAFFVDSRLPHSGRHSGRIWVPSAVPVTFGAPGRNTNLKGLQVSNGTAYAVSGRKDAPSFCTSPLPPPRSWRVHGRQPPAALPLVRPAHCPVLAMLVPPGGGLGA